MSKNNESRTGNVVAKLQANDPLWTSMPQYQYFDRSHMHDKTQQIYRAIQTEGYENMPEVDEALESTLTFIDRSFDMYEGVTQPDFPMGRVFAVPVRTERGDERYESEVYPFVPLFKSKFGVNAEIRQRGLVGLPPLILDAYSQAGTERLMGAVVLTPLFSDMMQDIAPDQTSEQVTDLVRIISENINETARFSRQILGAKVMGLGAILPKLTNFGKDIKEEGLVTTTGHAGTVHLIVETARKVIEEKNISREGKIGIIGGAGSIGFSSIATTLEMLPDFQIVTQDHRSDLLHERIASLEKPRQVSVEEDSIDVLRQSEVVIVAVTRPIDLDEKDPQLELDLSGKVIIDDSQPGCFLKEQIETRGGKLLWVVGRDGSEQKFLTRDNGYNFGDEAGIMGSRAIWGCEAEAGVIAASERYIDAIRDEVTPKDVRIIGRSSTDYGVEIADYQSYGQPVNLD